MKTINPSQLLKVFRPTKSTINLGRFQRNDGWLTNGFFAIKQQLEPKASKDYRFRDSKVNVQSILDKTTKKLPEYQEAAILNYIQMGGWDSSFLVKLKSESYEAWVNPRYISYVYQGMAFFKDLKIMIGESVSDPIAFVVDGEIQALVMGFRNQED